MITLESARITNLPKNAYYIPNFITVEEEERILKKVSYLSLFVFFQNLI
jgi:alkylated DNA repair protein alkB homolog 6